MVVNSQFLCIPPKLAGSSEKSYSATVIRESVIQFIVTNQLGTFATLKDTLPAFSTSLSSLDVLVHIQSFFCCSDLVCAFYASELFSINDICLITICVSCLIVDFLKWQFVSLSGNWFLGALCHSVWFRATLIPLVLLVLSSSLLFCGQVLMLSQRFLSAITLMFSPLANVDVPNPSSGL